MTFNVLAFYLREKVPQADEESIPKPQRNEYPETSSG